MKLSKRPSGTLRLIAGKHRSRIIKFNPEFGVRPTTDRIRETIFNWLGQSIIDARCLDLFAGSGAMGFEALSRGAKSVVMCDAHPKVVYQLKDNCLQLKEEVCCKILLNKWSLQARPVSTIPFHFIFLDPPFKEAMLEDAIDWCYATGAADAETLISFEAEKSLDLNSLQNKYQIIKLKQTKHIQYGLLKQA